MGPHLSRRSLLRAGAIGVGVLTLRPATALFARGGRTDGIVGFAGRAPITAFAVQDGAVARIRLVEGPGALQVADIASITTPEGFDLVGVGGPAGTPVLLGSQTITETERLVPGSPPPPDPTDPLAHLPEPAPPTRTAAVDVTTYSVRAMRLIDGLATAAGAGALTASLGSWSVRQGPPDPEGDHPSTIEVRRGATVVATLDGLGLAGPARLSGDPSAPVLSVDDGRGEHRVFALEGNDLHELPALPAGATTAVQGEHAIATVDDAPLLLRLEGLVWTVVRELGSARAAIAAADGPPAWLVEDHDGGLGRETP